MPKKQGVCINVGSCSKAKNRELQEAEISNFVCEECGKPLRESRRTPEGTTDNRKKKKTLIAVVAGLLAIGGGITAVVLRDNPPEDITLPKAAEQVQTVGTNEDTTVIQDPPPTQPKPDPQPEYGTYDGPRNSSGQPHGLGGEVKVTKAYSLDMKDGKNTVVELKAGDKIVNTKYNNGKLVQGQLKRPDGTQKFLSIGN